MISKVVIRKGLYFYGRLRLDVDDTFRVVEVCVRGIQERRQLEAQCWLVNSLQYQL